MTNVLASGPNARTYELGDLVALVRTGHVRIPDFQRRFRWGAEDVRRLFDSIIKGYPIGSVLLWQRPAEAASVSLGALLLDAPRLDSALWVVDGQQRLTSLANALTSAGSEDSRFGLFYDLQAEKLVTSAMSDRQGVIPLHTIFDLQDLLRWFSNHSEFTEYLDRASSLAKRIREFKVPANIVDQADEVVLREIFDRMNNYGKRLSRAEVFSALYTTAERVNDRSDIELIATNIDEATGFGIIDSGIVLKAVLARRGPDIGREIRNEFDEDRRGQFDFPGEPMAVAYQSGEAALLSATRFLQQHAGVPHVAFLPYSYLLVVLSRLFAHFPEPSPRNLELLRRWFWRAAVLGTELFKGSTTGAMRTLSTRIVAGQEDRSVQELLTAVSTRDPEVPKSDDFRTNAAGGKAILCAMWALGPRDSHGELFDLADLSQALDQQSTASEALIDLIPRRLVPSDFRLSAAERVIGPNIESEEELVGVLLGDDDIDLLAGQSALDRQAIRISHAIQPECHAAFLNGHIATALKLRETAIADCTERFMRVMWSLDRESTPPLGAFEINVEHDDADY